ncbi:MAG: hypothetical protein H7Y11_11160 [Armatimonadetes bacterium]|nr:hypothetical protein [Anaerolineae bacterium]
MSRRRFALYAAILASGTLALVGFGGFVLGILAEFFAVRRMDAFGAALSPTVQGALAGLCLSALMASIWFGLVALLIARQTRLLGSGYGEAYRLMEAFNFKDAIPLLERSLREGKVTSDVLMLLTSAYAYTGQLAKAQATADRAVALFPDDPGSYVTLANGYRLQAAYDEAASALKAALARAPDQAILWAELGFAQHFAGDEAAAFAAFQRAAQQPLPPMYGVRVYHHLAQTYQAVGDLQQTAKYQAQRQAAHDGLQVWQSGLEALDGTAYGGALRYEITLIERALQTSAGQPA